MSDAKFTDARPIDIFDPRGRVSRIGLIVIAAVVVGVQAGIYGASYVTNSTLPPAVETALDIVFAWLGYVSVSKRLHDIGYGAGLLLAGIAGISLAAVVTAVGVARVFSEDQLMPGGIGFLAVAAVVFIPVIAAVIWLHCKPGHPFANRFGPVPGTTGFSHTAKTRMSEPRELLSALN